MRQNEVSYGSYMVVPTSSERIIARAKQILYTQSYLPCKARLRHFAGVILDPVDWIIKPGEVLKCDAGSMQMPTAVGWKAAADDNLSRNAIRRMRLAAKRAQHAKRAIRRSLKKDWDD